MSPVERRGRPMWGIASGGLALAAIAVLSQLPYHVAETDGAMIRLTWRLPALVVESCRDLSAEEVSDVPAHMRLPEVCEGEAVPWVLSVDLDAVRVVGDTVAPAGLRGDRPLYVLRELAIEPGQHALDVRFDPLIPVEVDPDERRDLAGRSLRFEGAVTLESGEVILVTYDPAAVTLVTRRPLGVGR